MHTIAIIETSYNLKSRYDIGTCE